MQHFAGPQGPLLQTVPAAVLVPYWWNICNFFLGAGEALVGEKKTKRIKMEKKENAVDHQE